MIAVVWCALLLALVRMPGMEWLAALLLAILGPIIGATAQRCWGGRGVLGGLIGGIASYVGFGVVMYLRAYFVPQPNTVDYLGPVLSFLILASSGALVGLAVGILVWGVMSIAGPWGKT
jgi:hypothetical protein